MMCLHFNYIAKYYLTDNYRVEIHQEINFLYIYIYIYIYVNYKDILVFFYALVWKKVILILYSFYKINYFYFIFPLNLKANSK